MQRIRFLLILAFLCAVARGAWAQEPTWREVGDKDALNTAVQTDGANIKLTADITLSEKLTIGSGMTVTIDLNGKKLDRGTPEIASYNMVIHVQGNLTITDGSGNNSGQITGGRSFNGAGILCESGSTLTINGGTFTNNQVSSYSDGSHGRGGTILMNPNSTLTITGGKFENNSAYKGGAICNEGTAIISGASFTSNTASYCGGAIYNSGTLTFNSGSVSGSTAPYGGAIYNTGTYTMADGTISNCNSTTGGGGGIVNIGTVNISGGTFTNNTAQTDGGAIWNGNSGSAHGTLTITGGSFTGNTANRYGGGIWTESTATISGGEIKDNTALSRGGGVWNGGDATLTITGGSITGNTSGNYGGGVFSYSTFTMSGNPVITGNKVNGSANNLYLNGSTNKINCGQFTTGEGGANIYLTLSDYNRVFTRNYKTNNASTDPTTIFHGDISTHRVVARDTEVELTTTSTTATKVSTESELNTAISEGETEIQLLADIQLSTYVNISDGKSVTIDLNGHKLDRNLSQREDLGNVIRVQTSSTLTIRDSSGDNSGQITGGYDSDGGGICNYGTVTFEGGTITGCTGSSAGGAVYIVSGGTFTMTGGVIDGCTGDDGGAIYNVEGGTFTMSGGSITNNTCTNHSGGAINNHGTCTISGGTISGNYAKNYGGGIGNFDNGSLTITGGTITGNGVEVYYGGGVYTSNSITMSGSPNITGNEGSNLYLDGSSTVINCAYRSFTSDAIIGISLSDYNRVITKGYSDIHSWSYAIEGTYSCFSTDVEGAVFDNKSYSSNDDVEVVLKDQNGREYIVCSWTGSNTEGHVVKTKKLCKSYTTWNGTSNLTGGWYYFTGTKETNDSRIQVTSDSYLILADGCHLKHKRGIYIKDGVTLTIYGQSGGTGKLECPSADGDNAAIGGNDSKDGGHLIIHGGHIIAKADHNNAAGIGGGNHSGMRSVTIWGGTVEAKGKSSGAGIGTGQEGSVYPSVTIYGGKVTAEGGNYAAGIGGGEESSNGAVNIYGGEVYATGGGGGAGIGGGEKMDQSGVINIYGGYVEALGQKCVYGSGSYVFGAGIGGGGKYSQSTRYGNGGEVNIYGGTVKADSYTEGSVTNLGAACIGGGGCDDQDTVGGNGGTVTITGGTVELNKGNCGIGGADGGNGGTVVITGGTVKIHLRWPSGSDGMFIGAGDDDHSNGSLTLADNLKVSRSESGFNDASPYISPSGDRISLLQSHGTMHSSVTPPYENWVTIEACNHPSGVTYSQKNSEQHHVNCTSGYCKGYDENHTMEDVEGVSTCSECGYTAAHSTIKYFMATTDGSDYDEENYISYTLTNDYNYPTPECSNIPCYMKFLGWKQTADKPASVMVADNEDISDLVGEHVTQTSGSGTGDYYARYQRIWYNETNSGNGTQENPYNVATTAQLNKLAEYVNGGTDYKGKYFQVTSDLNYSGQGSLTAIGTESNPFNGTFDGQGHTIKNFTVSGSADNQGLFGYVGANGTVKNLKVDNVTVSASGHNNIGAIAGTNLGRLSNCTVGTANGTLTLTGSSTKGCIAGYNDGTLEGCVSQKDAYDFTGTNESHATMQYCLIKTNSSKWFANTDGRTPAFTVQSNTGGLTLDYGKVTTAYDYSGIEVYSFDQGNSETAVGLLWDNLLYVGGTMKVTFNANAPEGKGAANVKSNGVDAVHNTGDSWTLTMAESDALVTCTLVDRVDAGLDLYDDPATSNATTLDANYGQTVNAKLNNRTLFKDGAWNTICLPFDVSAEQLAVNTHPLYGATIMELDTQGTYDSDKQTGFDASDGTLYLYFKEVNSIKAREPYIVRWGTPENPAGGAVVDPTFYASYISSSDPHYVYSSDDKVSFRGNFDPVTLDGGDMSNLYLGVSTNDNGTPENVSDDYQQTALYYPSADRIIKSFRAYFTVDLRADNGGEPKAVRAFSLHFGDEGETTGIISIENGKLKIENSATATGWYDLQGRRVASSMFNVQSSMLKKGVYIYNGKKRIIK